MCDKHTVKDEQNQSSNLTRREFNTLAAGASVAFSFPAVANPLKTVAQDVDIPTADGVCDALFVHPAEGTHPAVLIWPDILALRPSFRAMATRLAESGYAGCFASILTTAMRDLLWSRWEKVSGTIQRARRFIPYIKTYRLKHTSAMLVPLSIGLMPNLRSINLVPLAPWAIAWVAPW